MRCAVEVCSYSMEDVLRAKQAGADRVELCADASAGGTTPSCGLVRRVKETVAIDVSMMIRPHGGDFVYSSEELNIMKYDIALAGQLGCECVVFGVLDETGYLDKEAMAELVQTARQYGLQVTCHRAFDVARQPQGFLEDLIDIGVDRLLTSGQAVTAHAGLPLLYELVQQAHGRIKIMPGAGIHGGNVEEILKLGVAEIHTGRTCQVPSTQVRHNRDIVMGRPGYDDDSRLFVDPVAVVDLVEAAKKMV